MSKCLSNWQHCCCHRQQRNSTTCNQHREPVESSTEEDEYPELRYSHQYPKCGSSNVNCGVHDNNSVLDQQTWQDLSSLRQKACRFIRSGSEWTSSSESLYPHDTCRRSENLVRKASDLIDYEPESSFLKKIKEQCQYWGNTHPVQNILSNYNEASDFDPCQQFKSRSGILKSGEQCKSGKPAHWAEGSARTNKPCKCCYLGEPSKTNRFDFNRNVCEGAGNEYNLNQASPRQYRIETKSQEKRGNEQCGDAEGVKKPERKSEHVSRPKKTAKSRGRKKRKSNSEEKSESEGTVESILKKPHQNSCERCWRYASPARSPVNKPEQRYDPNFRKAHSCTDFESERGDLNLEVVGRHISPCKNLQPVVNKNFVPLPTTQSIQKKPSSTKVKELTCDGPHGREPGRNAQVSRLAEDGRTQDFKSQALVCADPGQTPRPKSCTTGASSRGFVGNFTNFIDDLDVREYKEIHIRPRNPSHEAPDCNRFARNVDFNTIPTYRENPFSSCSRTNEQFNSRSKFEGDFRSPRENESSATTRSSKNNRRSDCSTQAQNRSSPKWDSTMYEDVRPKTSRTSSSKKSPGRSKESSSPKGGPNKERETKSAKSPRNRPSENLPPARTQSSLAFQENCPRHRGGRPQSTGQGSRRNGDPAARQCNQMLDCGTASSMWSGPPHAVRECTCYPRVRRYKAEENLFQNGGNEGHVYCCHCRWQENLRNQPSIYSQGASRGNQRNDAPCERLHGEANPERRFANEACDDCGCDRAHRKGPPDKAFAPTARERVAACPYREAPGERVPLRSHNLPENARCCPKGVGKGSGERDAPAERRHASRCPHSSYSPTKYCVFYMTKSKDEEKGNEVEVLVEELTQKNSGKKDAKAKDLGEKMKKILECPSDSMALRFQKGVSDSCQNVESSRILYF